MNKGEFTMKSILEFQKLDAELIKLQKEISNNPDKKNVQNMKSYILECGQKYASLDREAKTLTLELDKLKEVQAKGIALVEKYNNQDVENLNQEELVDLQSKMKQTLKHLNELDNRLKVQSEKIKNVLHDYDNNKKSASIAKQKYAESKQAFDEYYKQKEPLLNEIKEKMLKMQKELDSSELAKYKTLRQDNIFPVYVPLVNGSRCGGCRMVLPSNNIEKINKLGKLECEQCRRIIYVSTK